MVIVLREDCRNTHTNSTSLQWLGLYIMRSMAGIFFEYVSYVFILERDQKGKSEVGLRGGMIEWV